MKNEQLQAMGVTPFLGDTRSVNKGGKAAKRTLTDLCRECRELRDLCNGSQAACKALRDDACNVLERCIQERIEAGKLCAAAKKSMFREIVWGVCWSVVMLLFVIGAWIFN